VRIRSIIILTTGAAGAAAALVASPGTYEWLRRATGRVSYRHHYETEITEAEYADVDLGEESPAETDDLRLSLRARLAESAGDVEVANSDASTGDGVAAAARKRTLVAGIFVAVIVALLMMRIERTVRKPSEESPLKSFMQGFQFAMSDLPIRSALLLLSVLSLFGLQYSVFLPIYANDILKGGARTLANGLATTRVPESDAASSSWSIREDGDGGYDGIRAWTCSLSLHWSVRGAG